MNDTKRVLSAVITALILELIAGLLWVGAAAHRISHLESRLAALASVEVRAARLEEQTAYLRAGIERIEGKLDAALHGEKAQ